MLYTVDMICTFPDCGKKSKYYGLCPGHNRQKKHGQELRPLRKYYSDPEERFWARVDKTEGCWLWEGTIDSKGYGMLWLDKYVRAHRHSYALLVGPPPDILDHSCGIRHCVNPDHLRPVTQAQNCQNRRDDSTRGARLTQSGSWQSHCTVAGKFHSFGNYATKEEALAAAKAGRLRLLTHSDGR